MTPKHQVGPGLWISAHPLLSLAQASQAETSVSILGDILDPREPSLTNSDLAGRLAVESADFGRFEHLTHRLAGRWVAIVQIGSETRLYPDAGGTKSVFYLNGQNGLYLGSQPGLFVEAGMTERDLDLEREFLAAGSTDLWPLTLTPFRSVHRLIPNHYLDLSRGEAVRFWPKERIPHQDMEVAAQLAVQLLGGVVAGTLARGTSALPLTGGFDSRSIFAAAAHAGLSNRLHYTRVTGHHLPLHDTLIPRAIARRSGVRLSEIKSRPATPDVARLLETNTSGVFADPASYMMASFGKIPADYLLLGQLSEIAREGYYDRDPQRLEGGLPGLAKTAGYAGNPIAIREIGRWLEHLNVDDPLTPTIMLYWEHRIGTWASMLGTALDQFTTVLYPYCSRELIVTLLGVDTKFQVPPFDLHRRICDIGLPRLASIPFNDSWADRLLAKAPWKIRLAVARYRRMIHEL